MIFLIQSYEDRVFLPGLQIFTIPLHGVNSTGMEPQQKEYAIYIHGAGSGAKSGTKSAFLHYLPEYEWICPEVGEDPGESVEKINEYVQVFSPAVIAGTSMGGLYTLYADAPQAIKIVCNATVSIEKVLRKIGYGAHPFFCEREDGRTEYIIDEEMVRRFTRYKNSHSFVPGRLNLAVFSTDDELVGQVESRKNAKILQEAGYTVVWSDKFGHRLNENVAKKIPGWIAEISNKKL